MSFEEELINFKKELINLIRKYKISISHEDIYGGFEFVNYDKYCNEWLLDGNDKRLKELGL